MSLKKKTFSVFAVAMTVALIAVACGENTQEALQSELRLINADNTAVARQATIDAGGDPDAGGGFGTGAGSAASLQATNTAATSTALVGATSTPEPTAVVIEVPEGPTLTDADSPTIQIGDQGVFTPDVIKVKVGTTVVWENPRRSASSTASVEDSIEQWNSGAMSRGTFATEPARFSYTFTQLGCHQYASLFSGDSGTGAVCVVE